MNLHDKADALLSSSIYYMRNAEHCRQRGYSALAIAHLQSHIDLREQARTLAKQEKKP